MYVIRYCILLLGSSALFSCSQDPSASSPQKGRSSDFEKGAIAMRDSLDKIYNSLRFIDHPYETDQRVKLIEEKIREEQEAGNTGISPWSQMYAKSLLDAGSSSEAVFMINKVKETKPVLQEVNKRSLEMYKMLGIAYLRIGEQENCIRNHNDETCIFPIQGKGVHQDQEGSRNAIEIYEQILKVFPDDLESIYLLNLAYQTVGEYPDGVPDAYLIPPKAFESEMEFPKWKDVASQLGIAGNFTSGGTIVDDFDNDGYNDIMVSSWLMKGPFRYFHNNGDGTFEDWTERAGLGLVTGGLNMVQADYNNDGNLDFLLLRGAWKPYRKWGPEPNSLFHNNGDGTFSDVTVEAGIYSVMPTQSASWLDFNNDGWLDLFIGNESRAAKEHWECEFYVNNGDGTFRKGINDVIPGIDAHVKGVVATDYNNDGYQDLYLSIQGGKNPLMKNLNGEQFVLDSTNNVSWPQFSFPSLFFDINQDGWEDLIVLSYDFYGMNKMAHEYTSYLLGGPVNTETGAVFINENGRFTDRASEYGLDYPLYGIGVNFGDLTNNGYPGLYVGTGAPDYRSIVPNQMLFNDQGKRFLDITEAGGFGSIQKGHAVSFADIDNDGDQDVYINIGGAYSGDVFPNALFLNPGNDNHWVTIRLEGTKSNRSAIGAKVRLTVINEDGSERKIYQSCNSGGSFGCNSLQLETGLGKATKIKEIEVNWPNGNNKYESFGGADVDQVIKLVEGSSKVQILPQKPVQLKLRSHNTTSSN